MLLASNIVLYILNQFCIFRFLSAHGRTVIFDKLIKSFEELAKSDHVILSSRIVHDMTNNLNKMNQIMPDVCEKIMQYLHENRSMLAGKIVGRSLYALFTVGYEPVADALLPDNAENTQQQPIQFDDFGAIILRDFELLPGLTIVRACLALVFYRALSIELIEKVFDLNFLMRLENEITICYAKVSAHYLHFTLLIDTYDSR